MSEPSSELFRDEAVQHYQQAQRAEGEPLRASPVWLTASSYVLFAVALGAVLLLALVRLPIVISAPARIRASGEGGCELWAAVSASHREALRQAPVAELAVLQAASPWRVRLVSVDPGVWSASSLSPHLGEATRALSPTDTYALVRAAVEGACTPETLGGLNVVVRFTGGEQPLWRALWPR